MRKNQKQKGTLKKKKKGRTFYEEKVKDKNYESIASREPIKNASQFSIPIHFGRHLSFQFFLPSAAPTL